MNCPRCGYSYSIVTDSRNTDEGKRRRRQCSACGFRYTVVEILQDDYKKYKKMLKLAENLKKYAEKFCSEYEDFEN